MQSAECSYCPSITLGYYERRDERLQDFASLKQDLFHGRCEQCEHATTDDDLTLCGWCKHQRPYHWFVCLAQGPSSGDLTGFRVDRARQISPSCDYCNFLQRLDKRTDYIGASRSGFDIRIPGLFVDHPYSVGVGSNELYVRTPTLQLRSANTVDWITRTHGLVSRVNWDLSRQWLSNTSNLKKGFTESTRNSVQSLTDVRVIDINQSCIVHLPQDAEYVALSYVYVSAALRSLILRTLLNMGRWGRNQSDHFQLIKSKIAPMTIAGSLEHVTLPRSIADAIVACRNLGWAYLWVDRFCIVQDDEPQQKNIQLNQMGTIYGRAGFTIVALAGNSADYGLPGVSRPRPSRQLIFAFSDVFLCQTIPPLDLLICTSEWNKRGWTFQELQASSRCLFFTEHGVSHIDYRLRERDHKEPMNIYEDSTGQYNRLRFDTGDRARYYADMVSVYTAKILTFPSDILRAFSGVLYGKYGSRTVFGMPWTDFDRAVLWYVCIDGGMLSPPPEAGVYPSWSWISGRGQKAFHTETSYGLAYWARMQIVGDDSFPDRRVVVAEPNEDDLLLFSREGNENDTEKHLIIAGLAWDQGCIISPPPQEISVDCSRERYRERLAERWTNYSSYWQDSFGGYDPSNLFGATDIGLAKLDGRLLTYTQKASFAFDGSRPNGRNDNMHYKVHGSHCTYHIRSSRGRLVGRLLLDSYQYHVPPVSDIAGDFLALAVGNDPLVNLKDAFDENTHWSNEDYGCPCHQHENNTGTAHSMSQSSNSDLQHIEECRSHPEFSMPLPNQDELDKYKRVMSRKFGYKVNLPGLWKHYSSVSYYDCEGRLMHKWYEIPMVHVMLIAPSTGRGRGTGVYRRLGLGVIYLKRWVEAEPKFESVVLE